MTTTAPTAQQRPPFALVGFILTLTAGAAIGVAVITSKHDSGTYDGDLLRFCLTLIQVGGFGTVTALLLERHKQSTAAAQQQQAAENAARRSVEAQCRQMFPEARKGYDALKQTRRLLQDLLGKA